VISASYEANRGSSIKYTESQAEDRKQQSKNEPNEDASCNEKRTFPTHPSPAFIARMGPLFLSM
jgi:hypothetical protein